MIALVDLVQNVAHNTSTTFCLPITLWVNNQKVQVTALVDSGANTMFINKRVVKKYNLEHKRLARPRTASNADGTINKGGAIKSYVRGDIQIGTHKSMSQLFIADLHNHNVIIRKKIFGKRLLLHTEDYTNLE